MSRLIEYLGFGLRHVRAHGSVNKSRFCANGSFVDRDYHAIAIDGNVSIFVLMTSFRTNGGKFGEL